MIDSIEKEEAAVHGGGRGMGWTKEYNNATQFKEMSYITAVHIMYYELLVIKSGLTNRIFKDSVLINLHLKS